MDLDDYYCVYPQLVTSGGRGAVVSLTWAAALFVAAASLALCAAALARRPSRGLKIALALVAVWLVGGLLGALALRGEPLGGLGFVLLVLFALPLPIVPWLYARTFKGPRR